MNRAFHLQEMAKVPIMGRCYVARGLQPRVLVADHTNLLIPVQFFAFHNPHGYKRPAVATVPDDERIQIKWVVVRCDLREVAARIYVENKLLRW